METWEKVEIGSSRAAAAYESSNISIKAGDRRCRWREKYISQRSKEERSHSRFPVCPFAGIFSTKLYLTITGDKNAKKPAEFFTLGPKVNEMERLGDYF